MTDERFSKVKSDPRFRRLQKKHEKIKIDRRFKSMFTEESFQDKQVVDKYGRRLKESKTQDLKKYYHLEDEEEDVVEKPDFIDLARGQGLESSDDSDEESSNEVLEDEENEDGIHPLAEEENVEIGEETYRFALCNMDWDHIKAVDILKLLEAFKPKDGKYPNGKSHEIGQIKSVKIYKSEFGKIQMEKEALQGPPKEIFKEPEEVVDINQKKNKLKMKKNALQSKKEMDDLKKQLLDEQTKEEFNEAALRKYQLDRLKYFYSVIVCDSVETASSIYKQCDGIEFESSSNVVDLRYIPDDMEFDDEPVDEAYELPSSYKPKEFQTLALQHSSVKLSWEDDDPVRKDVTRHRFTSQELNKFDDFDAYLASDSEDSEDEEAIKGKYRNLLGEDAVNPFQSKDREEEMEITFSTGLTDVAKDLLGKKKMEDLQKDETVFESYIRKKKEKKKEKKRQRENELDEKDDDSEADTQNAATEAELELLLMDDNDKDQHASHFNMREIIKNEKKKAKKGKKSKDESQEDTFQMNLQDDRFKALYDEPEFSIDPSNPLFKKTKSMSTLISERHRRNKNNKQ